MCFPPARRAPGKGPGQQPAPSRPGSLRHRHGFVADCFLRLGELAHALADYQQALELSPGNLGVQRRVAAALHELGCRDMAAR